MILILLLISKFSCVLSGHVVEVYGDVHKDQRFFEETFPWLIRNLGGYVKVKYNLLGNGVYSVPQMCALSQISGNVFLQAEYLKCEAAGRNTPESCLCLIDVEPKSYRECVMTKGRLAGEASDNYMAKFSDGDVNTPIMESASWIVRGDKSVKAYFDKLCSLFEERQPYTCKEPIEETSHKGALRFNWHKDFGRTMIGLNKRNKRTQLNTLITKKVDHKIKRTNKKKTVKNNTIKYNVITFPVIEERLSKWLQYSI